MGRGARRRRCRCGRGARSCAARRCGGRRPRWRPSPRARPPRPDHAAAAPSGRPARAAHRRAPATGTAGAPPCLWAARVSSGRPAPHASKTRGCSRRWRSARSPRPGGVEHPVQLGAVRGADVGVGERGEQGRPASGCGPGRWWNRRSTKGRSVSPFRKRVAHGGIEASGSHGQPSSRARSRWAHRATSTSATLAQWLARPSGCSWVMRWVSMHQYTDGTAPRGGPG